jgi:hypothetical protein
MKKSIIILCSIAIMVVIAGIGLYNFMQHNKPIAKVVQAKKVIAAKVKTNDQAIKTLSTEKVNLQKALIVAKQKTKQLQNENVASSKKVLALSKQVGNTPALVFDNCNAQIICDSLAIEATILANQVLQKDSLYLTQTNLYDSINCLQEATIDKLKEQNTFLVTQTDTLLFQLNAVTKQNNQLLASNTRSKNLNKVMSGSLLAIGGYTILSKLKINY